MNQEIKKYADSGDRISLVYIFANSLDVDPTFEEYQEEYDYCKSKGILEQHQEITPFSNNPQDWTEAYWARLKTDLKKNFSDERMMHMKKVAQVFLRDQVERLRKERAITAATAKKNAVKNSQSEPIKRTQPQRQSAQSHTAMPTKAEQDEAMAAKRAEIAKHNKEIEARKAQQQSHHHQQTKDETDGGTSKKAIGIALLIVAIIVVIILLLK